ncbi:sporulation protein YunB [Salirhabdus salicampi]|uniref:sporulation protein YunB n=1 Tax=Salirhabdus salicampi TaxID=476102 RepID=UPI0020C34C81|nr:sporulation protein YunB [Salirhabdus salicampi]MCP8617743.1 sporulation protein YunB [Salirhabdus salicampi]
MLSKRKKKAPPPLAKVFMITIIFFMVTVSASLWFINEGIEPTLMAIAETKTKQFAREAINEAVSKRIAEDLEFEDLIQAETDEDGVITSMGWNSVVLNRVLRNTTFRVQNYLKRMERGEFSPDASLDIEADPNDLQEEQDVNNNPVVEEIPIGEATNIAILSNLGPKIPIRFKVIGDVQSDMEVTIEEYGINSALVKLFIKIEANVSIVIPFSTETTKVSANIPVDVRVIQGHVPEFYNRSDSGNSTPSITVPFNSLQ